MRLLLSSSAACSVLREPSAAREPQPSRVLRGVKRAVSTVNVPSTGPLPPFSDYADSPPRNVAASCPVGRRLCPVACASATAPASDGHRQHGARTLGLRHHADAQIGFFGHEDSGSAAGFDVPAETGLHVRRLLREPDVGEAAQPVVLEEVAGE